MIFIILKDIIVQTEIENPCRSKVPLVFGSQTRKPINLLSSTTLHFALPLNIGAILRTSLTPANPDLDFSSLTVSEFSSCCLYACALRFFTFYVFWLSLQQSNFSWISCVDCRFIYLFFLLTGINMILSLAMGLLKGLWAIESVVHSNFFFF